MNSKKALLAVSFGTSYPETRKVTIEALEKDLAKALPEAAFYRAWTSSIIRKKMLNVYGERIPSVEEALEEMLNDGITDLIVQPTHILTGEEFEKKIRSALAAYKDRFHSVSMGAPLCASDEDVEKVAAILEKAYEKAGKEDMAVFMGHGSSVMGYPAYEKLQAQFVADGFENFCIGTVEFTPGIAPVLAQVQARKPKTVYLAPLLIVAGDHATNDMAGDDDDSWKNRIAAQGCEVSCDIKGLGEYEEIRALYVQHMADAAPFAG